MAYTIHNPGVVTGAITAATVTVPNGGYSTNGTINITGAGGVGVGGSSNTVLASGGAGTYWTAPSSVSIPSVNIDSDGINMRNDTDIKIGEVSLKKFVEDVSKRLAIMVPNPKLEKDFEQLKDLRDQYEALEKELVEKARVWETLKKE